jgi:hypothetical protein
MTPTMRQDALIVKNGSNILRGTLECARCAAPATGEGQALRVLERAHGVRARTTGALPRARAYDAHVSEHDVHRALLRAPHISCAAGVHHVTLVHVGTHTFTLDEWNREA